MLFSGRFANYLAVPQITYRTGQTFDGTSGSVSSTQKKFGTYSFSPAGSNADRFSTTNHTDTSFTMECWVRIPSSTNGSGYTGSVFGGSNSAGSNTSFGLALYSNNIMTLQQRDGSNQDFSLGISLSTNTWYHIAVTRSGNTVKLFINGTQRGGDKTFTGTFLSSGDKLKIGSSTLQGSWYATSYIDEIRLSKIVRYDAYSIEPTSAFANDEDTILLCHCEAYPLADDTSVYDVPTADTYWSSVVYLGRFEDNLIDTKGVTTGITRNSSAAPTQAQYKYGLWSLNKPSGSSYLTLAGANNTIFNMGTGDFTVEYWIRFTNNPANNNNFAGLCLNRQANGTPGGTWSIYQGNTTTSKWKAGWYDGATTGGTFQLHSTELTAGVWNHMAYSRVSNTLYVAVNGVVENKGSYTKNITTAGSSYLGTNYYNEYNFAAHYDEVRVTKGVGRYTSNFTVPDKKFPNY